jgi:hypothetical protein
VAVSSGARSADQAGVQVCWCTCRAVVSHRWIGQISVVEPGFKLSFQSWIGRAETSRTKDATLVREIESVVETLRPTE